MIFAPLDVLKRPLGRQSCFGRLGSCYVDPYCARGDRHISAQVQTDLHTEGICSSMNQLTRIAALP